MVLNSQINVLTPETAPFVHFQSVSQPLRRFRAKPEGGGGMLDLEFFQKKFFFQKMFCSKIHFLSDVYYISAVFCYFDSYWRAGES